MRHTTLICVLTSLFSATLAHGEDWLQWRGPHRANHSMETGLFSSWEAEGPKLEWISEGLGGGYASV